MQALMNRKIKQYFVFAGLVVALAGAGCLRQDKVTVTISVPQMKSMECSKRITDALAIQAIDFAIPDTTTRTIAVTYDSKTLALKNVEFLISGAGFDANDTPANPEARAALPEGCR